MRLLAVFALSLLAAASSAASSGCATTAREIVPNANGDLALRRVHDVLVKRGFQCSLDELDLTCESDRTYKVVMKWLTAPNRLLFYAWFEAERSCVDQGPAIAQYNERYLIQLSCVDDMLRFFSSTYVPEAGLDGAELEGLLVSWSDEINATASELGLFGDGPAAADGPAAGRPGEAPEAATAGEAQSL